MNNNELAAQNPSSKQCVLNGPFLRWTGSKRWFTELHISYLLPTRFNNYHEPFLGGGSVFFHIATKLPTNKRKFFLSDSNEELINCYTKIKEDVSGIIKIVKQFKNSETDYYQIRNLRYRSDLRRAAKFLYLNRTSFNGIYRVNSAGNYNVPYGYRTKVDVITPDLLKSASNLLRGVSLKAVSFEKTLRLVKPLDLVFVDPPYTVAHENNGFIEYNQKLFSWEDQIKLRKFLLEVKEKGAYFIMTNACHKSIIELYSDLGKVTTVSRYSKVGGRNKTRGDFNELIVCNT